MGGHQINNSKFIHFPSVVMLNLESELSMTIGSGFVSGFVPFS